jgi:hypothetical protein
LQSFCALRIRANVFSFFWPPQWGGEEVAGPEVAEGSAAEVSAAVAAEAAAGVVHQEAGNFLVPFPCGERWYKSIMKIYFRREQ